MRPYKKSRVSAGEPAALPTHPLPLVDTHDGNPCVHRVRSKLDADTCDTSFVAGSCASQLDTLKSVLQGVAVKRENATVLVLGPRGSGKSALIRAALRSCSNGGSLASSSSSSESVTSFLTVELWGTTVDDDVSAAKELCRQLSLEGSLPRTRKPSLEHYLRFFLDSLKEGRAGNVPVAIILHNFELFAQRAKQTLLYNLFDITQSAKYQVCIIGTSSRLDVTELLEKRLRSRFSCRQVLLSPPRLEATAEFVASMLTIESDIHIRDKLTVSGFKLWNSAVSSSLSSKPGIALMQRLWRTRRSVAWYHRWMLLSLSKCGAGVLSVAHLQSAARDLLVGIEPEDAAGELLELLAPCDLLLVIAYCKLETGKEHAQYSFEMAYAIYSNHFRKAGGVKKLVSKPVLLRSVDKLLSLGILKNTSLSDSVFSSGPDDGSLQYQMTKLIPSPLSITSWLQKHIHGLPLDVRSWAMDGVGESA